MTAMTRWNPFTEMDELSNHLSSLLGTSPSRFSTGQCATAKTATWSPRVDFVEDENEYLIKADLPAIDKNPSRRTRVWQLHPAVQSAGRSRRREGQGHLQ